MFVGPAASGEEAGYCFSVPIQLRMTSLGFDWPPLSGFGAGKRSPGATGPSAANSFKWIGSAPSQEPGGSARQPSESANDFGPAITDVTMESGGLSLFLSNTGTTVGTIPEFRSRIALQVPPRLK